MAMERTLTIALAGLLIAGAAGCGDDSGGGDVTVEDICGDGGLYVDLVEKAFRCVPEFELFLGEFPSAAELATACDSSLGAHIGDGTVQLGDAQTLAACLAFIEDLDCETFEFDTDNACTPLIIGTLAEGDDCDSDDQCIGDAYCDRSDDGDCGACAPRKADLENCFEDTECVGRRCSGAGTTPGMCRSFGDVGDECSSDDDCLGQLVCNASTDKCQKPFDWAEDDDCESNDALDCGFPLSDLYCAEGTTMQCVPYLEIGDDCAGMLCDFKAYEWCDAQGSGKCELPMTVAADADCNMFMGLECADGLQCSDPGDGCACTSPAEVGDSCVEDDEDACGGFLLSCVDGKCQYGEYTGMCPAS